MRKVRQTQTPRVFQLHRRRLERPRKTINVSRPALTPLGQHTNKTKPERCTRIGASCATWASYRSPPIMLTCALTCARRRTRAQVSSSCRPIRPDSKRSINLPRWALLCAGPVLSSCSSADRLPGFCCFRRLLAAQKSPPGRASLSW